MNANPSSRDPEDAFLKFSPVDESSANDSCPLCGGEFREDPSAAARTCSSCGLIVRPTESEASAFESVDEPTEALSDPAETLDRWLAGEPIERHAATDDKQSWLSRAQDNPILVTSVGIAVIAAIMILSIPTLALFHERDQFATDRAEAQRRYNKLVEEKDRQERRLIEQVEAAERKCSEAELRIADADAKLRESWAKRLAAHSQRLREEDPQRSLLLATEAIHATLGQGRPLVPQARQTLRDALKDIDGRRLLGHTARITSLAISPDSRLLASGSFDKTARLWALEPNKDSQKSSVVLEGHLGCVSNVRFSPDGRWLTTGSFDSTARVWDLTKREPVDAPQVFRAHRGRIGVMEISGDSRWLVTGSSGFTMEENSVRLWDLSAPYPSRSSAELRGHTGKIHTVALSPDGRWIVTAGEDGMARLWDISAGRPRSTSFLLYGHEGAIHSAAFTADSQFLVTGSHSTLSDSPTLRLWKTSDKAPFDSIVLPGHENGIRTLATTPDSRRLISVGNDSRIRLWSLTSCDPSAASTDIPVGEEQVMAVAVSPDSRWLATGGIDGTTRLWDLSSLDEQEEIASPIVFDGHDGPIAQIAISPDNHWLVTAAEDGAIHVRTLRVEELIEPALERVVRENEILQLSSQTPALLKADGSEAVYISSQVPVVK